jgi:hypothetical protein
MQHILKVYTLCTSHEIAQVSHIVLCFHMVQTHFGCIICEKEKHKYLIAFMFWYGVILICWLQIDYPNG